MAKGPTTFIQKHVRHVIDQFRSGKRREYVLHGVEGLSSRTITEELLVTKRHHRTVFENLVEAVIEMDEKGLTFRLTRLPRNFSASAWPILLQRV